MAVHRRLGYGFLESVYQEALQQEFLRRSIPSLREVEVRIVDAGIVLDGFFKADFVAYSEIVVELKAVKTLMWPHRKQVINYLKATGMPLGLLLNFGAASLEWKRVVHTPGPYQGEMPPIR